MVVTLFEKSIVTSPTNWFAAAMTTPTTIPCSAEFLRPQARVVVCEYQQTIRCIDFTPYTARGKYSDDGIDRLPARLLAFRSLSSPAEIVTISYLSSDDLDCDLDRDEDIPRQNKETKHSNIFAPDFKSSVITISFSNAMKAPSVQLPRLNKRTCVEKVPIEVTYAPMTPPFIITSRATSSKP